MTAGICVQMASLVANGLLYTASISIQGLLEFVGEESLTMKLGWREVEY